MLICNILTFSKKCLGSLFEDNSKKVYKHNYPLYDEIDLASSLVEIGTGFVFAPKSTILTYDLATVTHIRKTKILKTIIGKNVFLGVGSVILPGINIGDNVIVGAGSIVTKDIPSGVVVAGNPAKVLSTVDDYIKKCEEKDVLYSLPDYVREKHGTLICYTEEEIREIKNMIQKEYHARFPF